MLRVTRKLAIANASIGVALIFSSCGGPEDLGPFALGVDADGVVIVACEELELSTVKVYQSVVAEGERLYPEVIADWATTQALGRGDELALEPVSPVSGVGGIQVVQADATYSVDALQLSGEGATATFRVPGEGLTVGTWLGSDQSLNSTPCDYRGQ